MFVHPLKESVKVPCSLFGLLESLRTLAADPSTETSSSPSVTTWGAVWTSFPTPETSSPPFPTSFPRGDPSFPRTDTLFPSVPTTYPSVPTMIRAAPTSLAGLMASSTERGSKSAPVPTVLQAVSGKRVKCFSGVRTAGRTPTAFPLDTGRVRRQPSASAPPSPDSLGLSYRCRSCRQGTVSLGSMHPAPSSGSRPPDRPPVS
jgi:hypothetical protein